MSYTEDLARRGMARLAAERKAKALRDEFKPVNVTITGHAWNIIGRTLDRAGVEVMEVHARIVELGRRYHNSQMQVQRLIEENAQLRKQLGEGGDE